ncbi:MAG: hypothetical protein U0610_07810 [bacterium]
MDLQKIGVKLYLEGGSHGPLADYTLVFHRWIQNKSLGGTLLDVVDYRHVHQGPGVMLVAFEFHLAIDEENGERGLTIDWKQPLAGAPIERVSQVLATALGACATLEREELPGGRARFAGERLTIRVGDRALCPNDPPSRNAFRAELDPLLARLYPGLALTVDGEPDPRRRLTAHVRAPEPVSVAELARRLGAPV